MTEHHDEAFLKLTEAMMGLVGVVKELRDRIKRMERILLTNYGDTLKDIYKEEFKAMADDAQKDRLKEHMD
ncbi:MAG: hypothetical protein ACXAEN_14735 [Candidatus Thorarchaeota archaeon]|jgi:hypothetical protein